MKVGRRTQAYFIGFLLGIALVSILIDSRRQRMIERTAFQHRWESFPATPEDLPERILSVTGIYGHVSAVRQLDQSGQPKGFRGYFFRNPEGNRFWIAWQDGEFTLYTAELLKVTAQSGFEYELMRSGFEHQGHRVVSPPDLAPVYHVAINPHTAMEFVDTIENLLSKRIYIALVEWIPWPGYEDSVS